MEEKMTVEEQISGLYSYIEQLEGELESVVNINTETVNGLTLDTEEFKRGLDETSYICGQISALVSVGVPIDSAFQYILSKEGLMYQELSE